MTSYVARIREALLQALAHDIVNTAKAAAYSGMLMFFPALLVITTLVAQVEEGPSLVGETRAVLEQFLPPTRSISFSPPSSRIISTPAS